MGFNSEWNNNAIPGSATGQEGLGVLNVAGTIVDLWEKANSGREVLEWESIRQGRIYRHIANDLAFARVNPITGIVIGVADATGVTDKLKYNKIDEILK